MDRVNVVLAVALVLVVALGFALETEGPTRAGSGPVFGALDVDRAARVEIVADERTVTLERGDDGVWRIEEAFGMPVAEGRVERGLFSALAKLSRADQAGAARAGFGFDAPARVRVSSASGEALVDLEQSLSERPASGGSFLSPFGESAVYRSVALPVLEARRSSWWSSRLSPGFEGIASRLSAELRTAEGDVAIAFERGDDGAWQRVDGDTARRVRSPQLVEGLLRDLGRLRFVDVVAKRPEPDHGFDAPTARFVVEGARALADPPAAGRTVTITVGGQAQEHLLATSTAREGEFVVAIDPSALEPLLSSLTILLAQ